MYECIRCSCAVTCRGSFCDGCHRQTLIEGYERDMLVMGAKGRQRDVDRLIDLMARLEKGDPR